MRAKGGLLVHWLRLDAQSQRRPGQGQSGARQASRQYLYNQVCMHSSLHVNRLDNRILVMHSSHCGTNRPYVRLIDLLFCNALIRGLIRTGSEFDFE
jgi:hypothetical protein